MREPAGDDGRPDAEHPWALRLIIISSALLMAVSIELLLGLASLGTTSASWQSAATAATQWADPLTGILLLAAVVLIAHVDGTTNAADDATARSRMSTVCVAAAVLATVSAAAAMVAVIAWTSAAGRYTTFDPWQNAGQYAIAFLFNCVAIWLAMSTRRDLAARAFRSDPKLPGLHDSDTGTGRPGRARG